MRKNAHHLKVGLSAVIAALFCANAVSAALTHEIRSKDTLYSIARTYHTTVPALQKANGIGEKDLLKLGRAINIPSASIQSAEPTKSAKASHVAKKPTVSKAATPNRPAKITKSKLAKRRGAGIYGVCRKDGSDVWQGNELVASLDKGAKFEVLNRDDAQYQIRMKDGKTGWILDNWVTIRDGRKVFPQSDRGRFTVNASNSDIIQVAMAYRGSRYSRGGMSSRGGFDCSGFVKFLYQTKGLSLPHSSRAQFTYGKSIGKDELRQGDVVFFAGTYRRGISHVGMYIGDGKFIHASTSRGGVRVDDLNSSYYCGKFAGARRIR